MAAYSGLYRQIRLYCRNVPEITMDHAILLAAREFCRKTWYVRETIEFTEVAGQAYYTLAPSDTTNDEVIGVVAVQRENYPLLPPTQQQEVEQKEGTPRTWLFESPNLLELVPYPAVGETELATVLVRVATAPTRTAVTINDELVSRYDKELAYGAISYLCSIPGEEWTNDKLVQMADAKFNEAMRHAKSDSIFGHKPWGNAIRLNTFNV